MAQAADDQSVLDCQATALGVTPTCSLCGSDRSVRAFEKAGQEYWRCGDCTLLFARERTNANFQPSIDDFEPAYRQYLDESPVDALNLDDVIGWIESYVDLKNPNVRLLDVGAGSGKLVRRLRNTRQCAVSGIEPSTTLFDNYRLADLGIEPISLPDLAARGVPPFDIVTVLDVLEHVPGAVEFLGALANVAKPGGFVFLSTPDAGGVLARVLGRHWHHCNAYHFSLYGQRAIAEAARRHGFETVWSGHHSKRMPIDYLWNYARDFLFARRRQQREYQPSRFAIPINLADTLHVVWRRSA
jgi:2-polyprenyl-3-methyl-5-hydroxy-6-metoxy-1,4-benzoquinol methylase